MPEADSLSHRIEHLVRLAGSQRKLAEMIGVSAPTIGGWIAGAEPYPKNINEMVERLGISHQWLVTGQGPEPTGNFEGSLEEITSGARGRLKRAMEARRLSPAQVAKLIGYQAGVVEAAINGTARVSERMIDALCREFPELSKEDLMDGSDAPQIMSAGGVEGTTGATPAFELPGKHKTRTVPLICWAAAGELARGEAIDETFASEGVTSNVPGRAFAVEVKGDSMTPEIKPGDYVVVRADIEARPGQVVLVRTTDGDVLCKRYSTRDGGKLVILSSVNHTYQPIELPPSEIVWIYPVKQLIRNEL